MSQPETTTTATDYIQNSGTNKEEEDIQRTDSDSGSSVWSSDEEEEDAAQVAPAPPLASKSSTLDQCREKELNDKDVSDAHESSSSSTERDKERDHGVSSGPSCSQPASRWIHSTPPQNNFGRTLSHTSAESQSTFDENIQQKLSKETPNSFGVESPSTLSSGSESRLSRELSIVAKISPEEVRSTTDTQKSDDSNGNGAAAAITTDRPEKTGTKEIVHNRKSGNKSYSPKNLPPRSSDVLIEGWMEKTGGGRYPVSKKTRRWFELTPEKLVYYKDNSKEVVKGEIFIDDMLSLEETDDDGWLTIYTPGIHGGKYLIRVSFDNYLESGCIKNG